MAGLSSFLAVVFADALMLELGILIGFVFILNVRRSLRASLPGKSQGEMPG